MAQHAFNLQTMDLSFRKKSESGMTLMYLKKTLFKNKVYECY